MTDAESTVRSAIMLAVVDTVFQTGLRAGLVTDAWINAVILRVFRPGPMFWATKQLIQEVEE